MNEQPQHDNLQPDKQQENAQPLYKAGDSADSSFSGYDLAPGAPERQPEASSDPDRNSHVEFSWEASEYIHHAKSFMWFVGYVAIMLALLAVAFFLTHALTFIALVIVMAVAMGVYASRPPRTLHYKLTDTSIQIEQSVYHYADFRAFGVINDGALYSVMLIPVKRFMPAVMMYFAEEDGEKIVDIVGARLPMQELHMDAIDRLMRRLRF